MHFLFKMRQEKPYPSVRPFVHMFHLRYHLVQSDKISYLGWEVTFEFSEQLNFVS
jgi:hypothetical protein